MKNVQYDYAVLGGDMRQVYLVNELIKQQKKVICYALVNKPEVRICDSSSAVHASSMNEAILSAHCIICPIPLCKDNINLSHNDNNVALPLNTLLNQLKSEQIFFAGCIPDSFTAAAKKKHVKVYDLMKDSALAVYNTMATAEGAICEAISNSPLNLRHSKCAVLGYGKCGRILADYLKGILCDIYIYSSDTDELAVAGAMNCHTGALTDFESCAGEFDFIFNTVPAKVITASVIDKLKLSVTVIDIASFPGGADYEAAKKRGINAILCPGLPGRYSPYSSAIAIKNAVESCLNKIS